MKRNRESLSFRLHGFSKVLLRQSGCPDRKGGNEQEKPEPSYVYALRDRTRALKGKFGYDKSSQFRGQSRRNRLMERRAASSRALPFQAPMHGIWCFPASTARSARHNHQMRHDFGAVGVDASLHGRGATGRGAAACGDGTCIRQVPAGNPRPPVPESTARRLRFAPLLIMGVPYKFTLGDPR